MLDPSHVAVLLNRNARRVTAATAMRAAEVVGDENLFDSHSLEQADSMCREIVQRGYGTVVCGGGDGTLIGTYNAIRRYVRETNAAHGTFSALG